MKIITATTKIFLLLCAFALSAAAETKTAGDYSITLKAANVGAIYDTGEKIDFILEVSKAGKPFAGADLDVKISKDEVAPLERSSKKSAAAREIFSASLADSGVVKCQVFVKLPDVEKRVEMLAGAAVKPLSIAPSVPEPVDFVQFWDAQKKILADIPLNMQVQPRQKLLARALSEKLDLFVVKADTFGGKLDAYMVMPKNAAPKSLPAIVIPHGAGVRYSRFGGVAGAAEFAKRGFLAIDFNALGLDSDGSAADLEVHKKNFKGYPYKDAKDRQKNIFRTIYLRALRALDVAMAQPQWDGKNLVVFGTSQGGGQALAMGGLSDKVTLVCAFVPALCDMTGFVKDRVSGWPHYVRADKNGVYGKFDKSWLESIPYFDGTNFARHISAPSIITIDLSDDVCQPTTGFAMYSNLKKEKILIINPEARHGVPRECYLKVADMVGQRVSEK